MQSYESSDEESSEESENEDHTTEQLPSAVAGEPGEGQRLGYCCVDRRSCGCFLYVSHVRNAYHWVKGTYHHMVKTEEPVVKPSEVPKSAPAIKYNKLASLDDPPQFKRYINPSGPHDTPVLDTLT